MARPRKLPQRMCVGCRQMRSKRDMIRIVRGPEGEVRIDPGGKAPGRGAYVDLTDACVTTALREKRLGHALEIEIPDGIAEELRELLARPRASPPKIIRIRVGSDRARA